MSAACELPAQLGDLPGATADPGSSSGGDDQGGSSGGEEPTGGASLCGDGAAGELQWSREGAQLPGLLSALGVGPGGELVTAGHDAASETPRVRVQKHDPAGAPLWSQSYAGAAGLGDTALDVVVDGTGHVDVLVREIVGVTETEDGGHPDGRMVVLRYAPDGALAWRWEHERPPAPHGVTYWPLGAIGLVGETIVVLETDYEGATERVALHPSGVVLGDVELAIPWTWNADGFDVAADGSVFVAGDFVDGASDGVWVGRFAATGEALWIDQFGGQDDEITMLVADGEDGVHVAWKTIDAEPVAHKLRRYGPAGASLWTVPLPMASDRSGVLAGAVRCDGTLLLTGGIDRPPTEEGGLEVRKDLWVARYGPDGAALWTFEQLFEAPYSFGEGLAIAATPGGDAVVAGMFMVDASPSLAPWFGLIGK